MSLPVAQIASRAGVTGPLWTGSVVSGAKTVNHEMGKQGPFGEQSGPAGSLTAPIIPVAFTLASGGAGGKFNPAAPSGGDRLSE